VKNAEIDIAKAESMVYTDNNIKERRPRHMRNIEYVVKIGYARVNYARSAV
jgi:hypothetical protein